MCAGGGRFWTLSGCMLASHGHLAFAQDSGLVAAHRGRVEGVSSAQIELSWAPEELGSSAEASAVCAGGGHFFTSPWLMLASHGHLAFAQEAA